MDNTQIAIPTFLFLSVSFLSFLYLYNNRRPSALPINWPIFGMILSILSNFHRILDYLTEGLTEAHGSFLAKGPWFSKIEILVTADPVNAQYILAKRYEDFNRGPNFKEFFDGALGEGIINSDFDKWRYQRRITIATFGSTHFQRFMISSLQLKLENDLIPLLRRYRDEGVVVDLQEVFSKLGADVNIMLLVGQDANLLSNSRPSSLGFDLVSLSHAALDAISARHVLPNWVWKLQRRLGVGNEGKHREFTKGIDGFIYECIRRKREEVVTSKDGQPTKGVDLISTFIREGYGVDPSHGFKSSDVFLRDTFANLLFAGKDTMSALLTWFFWLLTEHPRVEAKIKEELIQERDYCTDVSQLGKGNKLVYLHAAICETLRLYPPSLYVHRAANQHETLPSGHQVKPWTMIIISSYVMGRLKWVWGEDCKEFKPERWITDQGTIKHEPSHKFFAFSTGMRLCPGKEIAFMLFKEIIRQVLLQDFRFEVVQGHCVQPMASVGIRMKHGLKVKVM